jgi:hypothetical protein
MDTNFEIDDHRLPLPVINGCENSEDCLLTNWSDRVCCESRESGSAPCVGLVFFTAPSRADLRQIIGEGRILLCTGRRSVDL